MITASLAYDKTGDEYAFTFTFTLFCFTLAIFAIALLLTGIHRKSPYFLLPHLLGQVNTFALDSETDFDWAIFSSP